MSKRSKYLSLLPIYTVVLTLFFLIGAGGSKAITVLSESAPVTSRRVMIIDAGHGGEDGGTTSCTGVLESKINLEIALKLNDLMHILGIKTVLTRDADVSLHTQGNTIASRKVSDLKERVRIINSTTDAILVSIHQNHFSDSRYSGAQVFYAPTEGSQNLAELMQNSLKLSLNPGSNRQIKKADNIYLMQNIELPGVLVECGFLSNTREESLLRDPNYQNKLCCVVASCCSRYLHTEGLLT